MPVTQSCPLPVAGVVFVLGLVLRVLVEDRISTVQYICADSFLGIYLINYNNERLKLIPTHTT